MRFIPLRGIHHILQDFLATLFKRAVDSVGSAKRIRNRIWDTQYST